MEIPLFVINFIDAVIPKNSRNIDKWCAVFDVAMQQHNSEMATGLASFDLKFSFFADYLCYVRSAESKDFKWLFNGSEETFNITRASSILFLEGWISAEDAVKQTKLNYKIILAALGNPQDGETNKVLRAAIDHKNLKYNMKHHWAWNINNQYGFQADGPCVFIEYISESPSAAPPPPLPSP